MISSSNINFNWEPYKFGYNPVCSVKQNAASFVISADSVTLWKTNWVFENKESKYYKYIFLILCKYSETFQFISDRAYINKTYHYSLWIF